MKPLAGAGVVLRACLLFTALHCAACSTSVRFRAATVVNADGSIVRTSRMALGGDLDEEFLTRNYILLPGGSWGEAAPETSSTRRVARIVYGREYSLTQAVARGEPVAGDYRRKARVSAGVAANEIRVRRRNFWFVDTYFYEERFSDIVSIETLSSGIRAISDLLVDELVMAAAGLPEIGLSADQLETRLSGLFSGPLERILELTVAQCLGDSIDVFACLEDVYEQDDDVREFVALIDSAGGSANVESGLRDALVNLLLPEPAAAPAIRRERIQVEVVDVAMARLGRFLDSDAAIAIGESIAGVSGWGFFETYPFELSLRLPGTVVRSNAEADESGVLHWAFEAENFVLNDRVLSASSRRMHGERVLVGLVAVALLIVLAAWLSLRDGKDEFTGRPV